MDIYGDFTHITRPAILIVIGVLGCLYMLKQMVLVELITGVFVICIDQCRKHLRSINAASSVGICACIFESLVCKATASYQINILPYFTQSKNEIGTACTEAFRPHLSKNASSRKVKREDMRTTAVCILWWSSVRVVSSSIVWLRTLRNCWGPRANCTTYFIFVDISLDMFWHGVKIAGQSRKTFIWFHLALSQNYLKIAYGPQRE